MNDLLSETSNQLVTSLQEIDKTRERMLAGNQEVKIPAEVCIE
jgi:hypothetical protein